MSDALVRAVEVGGLTLFRDLFLPLLMSENWLLENRSNFLVSHPQYAPLEPDSGHFKLLSEAGRKSDWDLPYEQLDLSTLIITGLQDHVFFEKDVVAELFASLPKGRRVDMPEAGHLIPGEQPGELAKLLISFATEVFSLAFGINTRGWLIWRFFWACADTPPVNFFQYFAVSSVRNCPSGVFFWSALAWLS